VGFWFGHGAHVTGINRPLIMRFGHLGGMQVWIRPCLLGHGRYGLALTGVIETNTKEDMAEHSRLVILWGANLASQPTTSPHLVEARRRGARVIAIDVRRAEASRPRTRRCSSGRAPTPPRPRHGPCDRGRRIRGPATSSRGIRLASRSMRST